MGFSIEPLSEHQQKVLLVFHGRIAEVYLHIFTEDDEEMPTFTELKRFLTSRPIMCSWVCEGTILLLAKIGTMPVDIYPFPQLQSMMGD